MKQVSWALLKQFADGRGISLQYVDLGDTYWVVGVDGSFHLECYLNKTLNVEETAVFETTYKPVANKPIAPKSANGQMLVEANILTGAPGTKSISMVSPDFGDRTSWYQKSVQVTLETLQNPSADFKTYTSANPWWINMTGTPDNDVSGWGSKCTYTWHQVPKRDGSYGYHTDWDTVVTVDDVVQTSGYKINYRTGQVIFTNAQNPLAVVKATYWTNNNVVNPSEWLLTPPAGKKFIIQHVELNFSVGTKFGGTIRFEIWGGASLATYGSFPDYLYTAGYGQARYDYRNARDVINAANEGQGQIDPFGELTKPVSVMPFEYAQAPILSSVQGVIFRTVILNNAEMTNTELVTSTFYLVVAPA